LQPSNRSLPCCSPSLSSTSPPSQALVASRLCPGVQLSAMLADILAGAGGLTELDLGSNGLDDAAACGVMEALGANEGSAVQVGGARTAGTAG
jgi:hypothetical protein